jgi:hypothetical protein
MNLQLGLVSRQMDSFLYFSHSSSRIIPSLKSNPLFYLMNNSCCLNQSPRNSFQRHLLDIQIHYSQDFTKNGSFEYFAFTAILDRIVASGCFFMGILG